MKFLKLQASWLVLLSLGILLITGCRQKTADASDTDSNGYQCQKCKAKFYTDKDVWAEFCPACKTGSPSRISGVICPKDHHLTIPDPAAAVGPDGMVKCEKCGASVDSIQLPRASDFQAWGATKKTRKEVCAN